MIVELNTSSNKQEHGTRVKKNIRFVCVCVCMMAGVLNINVSPIDVRVKNFSGFSFRFNTGNKHHHIYHCDVVCYDFHFVFFFTIFLYLKR
mgnify:FL=1